ncbi:NAD(P)H-hydrate dehydratase [Vibrio gallicus]|uniref:NAD(P)H-hydrate dehydratase n=1 Tax=Vibrio gallicus TaxID=190897 RepID=UPI0021C2F078|nr:NAD(P)H-hydrate dehydratase [Vibrio gallicus]
MVSLYLSQQVKIGEVEAAQRAGVPMYELMERAGAAAFERLESLCLPQHKLLVCCGSGNNGGDGFVVARLAKQQGYEVTLYQPDFCDSSTADSIIAKQAWLDIGGEITSAFPTQPHAIIVDGLLGTGLVGNIRANMLQVIAKVNASDAKVLALDIPSGLNADNGTIIGDCVQADATVSFIGLKSGLVTGKASSVVGALFTADLDINHYFTQAQKPYAQIFDRAQAMNILPHRDNCSHKGDSGRVSLVGGATGYCGAIVLSAQGCVRSGAGLVSVLTSQDAINALLCRQPEVMAQLYSQHGLDKQQRQQLSRSDVIAIGPGLGQQEWGKEALREVLELKQIARVFDADALNLIANISPAPDLSNAIITPHPGEAARLLNLSIAEIEQDRYHAAERLYEKYAAVVVLKGPGTIVYDGKHRAVICAGNSGMASGGMGDVLTGAISALIAQGLSITHAAMLGAWLHSTAADNAAKTAGKIGIVASDLLYELRSLLNAHSE